jgi:hypothetical protein
MDQAAKDRVQQELRQEAVKLFGGAVSEVAVLEYGDDPMVEPGEVMVRVTTAERAGRESGPPRQKAMSQFRRELAQRLPEVRRVEVRSDDAEGHHKRFLTRTDAGPEESGPADSDFTPVMVRMKAPELEIVDTLINVGIAPNRAEAVRWALARISERPAYAQLRERTREIERLKTEF